MVVIQILFLAYSAGKSAAKQPDFPSKAGIFKNKSEII